jgi:hypothetical protein
LPKKKIKLGKFAAVVRAMPDELHQAGINGARKAGAALVVLVTQAIRGNEPYPLVDRGRLVQDTNLVLTPDGCIVRNDAPHAAPQEYGARPFTAPRQVLLEWAKRKGFDDPEAVSWAVWQKFRKEGMKPKRFFARALAQWKGKDTLKKSVIEALNKKPDDNA